MTTITDEMVEKFDIAFLDAYYPNGHDFVASQGLQRDGIVAGLKAALSALSNAEGASDAKLGEITDQDREYAADLIDDYKEEITGIDNADDDRKRQIETVAQWLRKVRHQAVIDDRESRSEPAPDRNAVIEDIVASASPVDFTAEGMRAHILAAIRALKSPSSPSAESEVMPNQPATTGNNKTPPHSHPSANADAGGAQLVPWTNRLREDVAWALIIELHKNVAEADRPLSWSDLSDNQRQRALDAADHAYKILELEGLLNAAPQPPDDWVATSENINALPDPLRHYIHTLETECDPQGTIRENHLLRGENKALRHECELLAAAPKPQVAHSKE